MILNENALLLRMAEGDTAAFRRVFDEYYPKVRVFFSRFVLSDDDAKDLAQNVFVKLWTMRSALREVRSFGAYLFRMCRNAAIDYGRKHNVRVDLEEDYAETYPLDEEYFARETRSRMESRIAAMPEKRRRVVTLSRLEGMSNEEIALKLGISKKTVENHLNAALRELRKITS